MLLLMVVTIGSLSNNDGNHINNFKKQFVLWAKQRFAHASRFLVHFFDVHCMTTTWNLQMRRFMEDVDIRQRIFLSLFEPG